MKVIAVTGASAGVGRAVVRRFARDGARLGLIARGRERLEAAASEVERLGGEALVLPLDVSEAGAVDEAAGLIEERFGPLDVWVNNAMATVFARVSQIEPDEFRRATEVTYLGYVWGTQAALRRMLPREHWWPIDDMWAYHSGRHQFSNIDRYRESGLDGVECFYPTYSAEQTKLLAGRCRELGLLTTGSSDYHGPTHKIFSRFLAHDLHGEEPELGRVAQASA